MNKLKVLCIAGIFDGLEIDIENNTIYITDPKTGKMAYYVINPQDNRAHWMGTIGN